MNSMLLLRNVLQHVVVRYLAAVVFVLFLALYVRTAAPSVLSGDSAEFQMAAPLLGVPHPTTYPLYILLGKLATLVIPFGDLAWRVTLVSAACAALAVALFFGLARRLTHSTPAALLGALALGLAPGLWNAATMAEVYALMMALLAGLVFVILLGENQEPRNKNREPENPGTGKPKPVRSGGEGKKKQKTKNTGPSSLVPRLAAFIGGMGFAHLGLFVTAGMPILAAYLLWSFFRRGGGQSNIGVVGRWAGVW